MVQKEWWRFCLFDESGSRGRKVFARKLLRVSRASEGDIRTKAKNLDAFLQYGRNQHIIEILAHGWLEGSAKIYFMDMELAEFSLAEHIKRCFNGPLSTDRIPNKNFQPIPPSLWHIVHAVLGIGDSSRAGEGTRSEFSMPPLLAFF